MIAFEDLTHIRDRTGRRGPQVGVPNAIRTGGVQSRIGWSLGKAGGFGVHIETVRRVWIHSRQNRPTRNDFRCVKCESEANADYNAAKNIGMRYVRRGQQSSRRTGNSQLALKSGTVTPSGVFIAHPEGFEVEFMDKPRDQKSMTSG